MSKKESKKKTEAEEQFGKIDVRVQLLTADAKLPTRNHDAAGLDLYVTSVCPVSGSSGAVLDGHKEVVCAANRVYMAKTGIAVELPEGYFGMIKPRSGLSLRHGMMVGGGVVDNDYRGEVMVIFTVESSLPVKAGDKIAQLVLLPYLDIAVVRSEELAATARGDKGLGSSGK